MKQPRFATIPFNPSKSPIFYGWVVILMGTLGLLMTIPGQTIGLSTFTDSLIDALSISRDNLSWAYMGGTIGSSLFLTKAGRVFDRYGTRPVAITASICLGLGLVYMSQVGVINNFLNSIIPLPNLWIAFPVVFLGFMIIRFFGQGVLNLASRTMMMKWFDDNRGFAMGCSSVFVTGGFSMAPAIFESLIQSYTWKGAWINTAMILIFVFPILIFIFYRDNPKDVGLKPDGDLRVGQKKKVSRFPIKRDFELKEAKKTLAFWVFAGFLGMYGLYITGFTFHVVSIFEQINVSREDAVKIFQPIAITSVAVTLLFGVLSDHFKLKYLLYIMGFGAILSIGGLMTLSQGTIPYYSLIVGTGVATGAYAVVSAVSWPRFYGKTYLGAINGMVLTILVFGSALGPILLSKSLTWFGTYNAGALVCLLAFVALLIAATRVVNPQTQIDDE